MEDEGQVTDWSLWALELWDYMFAFVDKKDILSASLVSRDWRYGALSSFRHYKVNSHYFAHIPLRAKREEAMGGLLQFLSTFCPNLWLLDLSRCYNISEAKGVHYPTSIHTLILEKCTEITDKGLVHLPPKLKRLNLTGCGQVTDNAMKLLPHSLTDLDLTSCWMITDAGVGVLPTKIKKLTLDKCWKVSFKHLPPSLHVLIAREASIPDAHFKHLPRNLHTLNLEGATELTGSGFQDLPPSLTSLNVNRCPHIGFGWLPSNLQELTYRQGTAGENLFFNLPPSLKKLDVAQCESFCESWPEMIPEGIEELDLSGTKVTDKDLSILGDRLKNLKKIILHRCKRLQFPDVILGHVPVVDWPNKGW